MRHKGPLSEFAIASLALGILSFVPFGLGNLACAVLAIIFGVLALKKIAAVQSVLRGEGLAAAGIVLAAVWIVVVIIVLVILAKNPALLEQMLKRPLPR